MQLMSTLIVSRLVYKELLSHDIDGTLLKMNDGAALTTEGRTVFELFNQSITLSQIFCQAGENPEQMAFNDALLRLCTYSPLK